MAFDRFLIAPFQTGLQTDLRPWLIPDDAMEQLTNAYVFRGRIRKRFGSDYMVPGGSPNQSRLRVSLGMTDGSGNASGTVPGNVFAVGQQFSVGSNTFTVSVLGTPGTMLTTGPGTGTYNTSTGAYAIAGAPATTTLYWYPATPVMGFVNLEVGPINNQPSFAFDTQFAYEFTSGVGWNRSVSAGNPIFHGTDINFFWSTNYQGEETNEVCIFTTNFYTENSANSTGVIVPGTDDPIWSFEGNTWAEFSTSTVFSSTGQYVQTCRIIVPFHGSLILLNTIETTDDVPTDYTVHPNRARYSFDGSPFAVNAWLEDSQTFGGLFGAGGGFIDASTEEQIITAEFIKDRLIVFFERSTWEIVYTGNRVEPFRWQKINTELGAESQNSSVPFDKEILTISNVGVHACNGANVVRIDNKIPDDVFEIIDKNIGVQRVAGIRDYYVECVYWSFPSTSSSAAFPYPNRILLYNYRNQTWAFNDDVITAFGYYEQQGDETWADNDDTWQEAQYTWQDGVTQAQFRQVMGGNQEGFTFLVLPDRERNAGVLQITNISIDAVNHLTTITVINHMLTRFDTIALENLGTFSAPNIIYYVVQIIDQNTIVVQDRNFPNAFMSGTYTGGGTIARVSNINIKSKQWNPYNGKEGRNLYLHKIDFGVVKTSSGQVTIEYFPSSSFVEMVRSGRETGALMGTGVLETSPYNPLYYPLERFQQRLWHPVYFQSDGECIQIEIFMTSDQILNPAIAWSDFQIEGMVLYTKPTSSRLQ